MAVTVARRELQDRAREWCARWEAVMIGQLQSLFADQEADTLARLHAQTKALDPSLLFDSTTWDEQTRQQIGGIIGALYQEVGEALYTTFNVGTAFNLHDPRVTEALGGRVNKLVGVNATTQDAIRTAIIDAEAQGASISGIASAIQSVFSDASTYRAVTIARTEVVGATNEANYVAAATSGLELTKSWLATEDERTRPSHLEAEQDNQDIAMDDTFTVGGADLLYPGDPAGPPEEVINCRCVVIYSDGTQSEAGDEALSPADDGGALPTEGDIEQAVADAPDVQPE